MSIRHSRSVPVDADSDLLSEVEREVRSHLSAVADSDDDPDTNADDVRIWHEHGDDELKVVGELDAEPDAPYLRDDFDPDDDSEFEFVRYSEEGRE